MCVLSERCHVGFGTPEPVLQSTPAKGVAHTAAEESQTDATGTPVLMRRRPPEESETARGGAGDVLLTRDEARILYTCLDHCDDRGTTALGVLVFSVVRVDVSVVVECLIALLCRNTR